MKDELRQAIDTIPGFVWSALPDGNVDFLNQRWCDYTGVSLQDASGRGWLSAIHPEDLPRLVDDWSALLNGREPGEFEARLRRSDGTFRWFLIRAVPLCDAADRRAYLAGSGRAEWIPEITETIFGHHKVSRYRGRDGWLVEPFRRADWMDVSMGAITCELSRRLLAQALSLWPRAGFHKRLVQLALLRVRTHPWSPLPMVKL